MPVFGFRISSLFLIYIFVSCDTNSKKETFLRVIVKPTLAFRLAPDSNSPAIGQIPHGSEVADLQESGPNQTILGLNSDWKKVEWNGKSGWVFGAFITTNTESKSYVIWKGRAIEEEDLSLVKEFENECFTIDFKGFPENFRNGGEITPIKIPVGGYYFQPDGKFHCCDGADGGGHSGNFRIEGSRIEAKAISRGCHPDFDMEDCIDSNQKRFGTLDVTYIWEYTFEMKNGMLYKKTDSRIKAKGKIRKSSSIKKIYSCLLLPDAPDAFK